MACGILKRDGSMRKESARRTFQFTHNYFDYNGLEPRDICETGERNKTNPDIGGKNQKSGRRIRSQRITTYRSNTIGKSTYSVKMTLQSQSK